MIQVIDDFFPDPFLIRSESFKCKYFNNKPQYPGKRYESTNEIKNLTLGLLKYHTGENFKISKKDPEGVSFNFINSSFCEGMPHSDHPVADYSCIVFLNPNPIKKSGIEIYQLYEGKNINPMILKSNEVKEKFSTSGKNRVQRFFYSRCAQKTKRNQKYKIEIEHKLNRMVIFDSGLIHSAQKYFGKNKKDCRLTLMAFLTIN